MTSDAPRMTTILHEWLSVLRRNAVLAAAVTLLIIALYQACDMIGGTRTSNVMGIPIGVIGQYFVVEAMLGRKTADPRGGKRHFASLFVAALVGNLCIIAAMLLLVVPGLYLAARWMAATPLIVEEDMGGIAALKASWAATADMAWSIVLAMLVGFTPLVAVSITAGVAIGLTHMADDHPIALLFNNIWVSFALMLGWSLSVALYRLIKPASGQLDAIFA